MLGVLFDSYLFEGRAPDGNLLVRAFLGGAVDPEVTEREDQELVELVRGELGSLLGVRSKPLFSEVVRWQRAIPQYEIGHLERVASIEQAVARVPGLFLAGNALHGIAFGKAAAAGVRAGQDAATYLAREEGESGGLGARGLH
jgi:oxygen-dependent protoporphyrinogen oxidase